jgi:hypothetical protein
MGTLDLGMDDEAEAERRRLEEERRRRRAAAGEETAPEGEDDLREARQAALRDLSGMPEPGTSARVMEDVERDAGRPAAPPASQGHRMSTGPAEFTAEERERIGGVESRLQAGDRAGVERDTERDQRGTARRLDLDMEPIEVSGRPAPGIARPVQRASDLTSPIAAAQRAKPIAASPSERLDAGLPSEADIGRARTGDDWRRVARGILGAIGGMYTGRTLPEMRSNADALQQRRDAGLRERMGQKREDVERQDAAALRTAQMDAEREQQAQTRQVQESQIDIQRRRAALSERQFESEAADAERTRAADAALDQADSPASATERTAVAVRLSQLHPRQRQEALAAIGGPDALQQMTGRQARALLAQLARPVQARGTGGGLGDGRGARAPGREGVTPQQASQERIAAATARGIDPAAAEQLERSGDLARIVAQDALTRGPQQRAQEYGERIAMSGLARADEALRAVERFARQHPGDLPGQGVLDTWGGMRPQFLQSPAGREWQRLTRRLLDSELRQATGANAPESEVTTFRQILGLSESSSDEDVMAALGQARQYVNSEYNALRGAYGPDAVRIWEQQARASQDIGTQDRVVSGGDRVRVRRADGQTGHVSRAAFDRDQRQPAARRQYTAVE